MPYRQGWLAGLFVFQLNIGRLRRDYVMVIGEAPLMPQAGNSPEITSVLG
jgi:hypothetical protein